MNKFFEQDGILYNTAMVESIGELKKPKNHPQTNKMLPWFPVQLVSGARIIVWLEKEDDYKPFLKKMFGISAKS